MSSIKLKHSGGNSVSLNPPTSAPTSSDVAFKLPTSDGSAGQVLKTDGSGNLSWVSQPTAGITMVDQYCLQANKSVNGNAALDLDADFVRVSGNISGGGHVGTGMTKSGAIFSFPSTGIYKLFFSATVSMNSGSTGNRYAQNPLLITTDNSNYTLRAMGLDGVDAISGESFGNPVTEFVFDVTDTSLCKCKFQVQSGESNYTIFGQSGRLDTFVTFTRIGDT